MQQYRFNDNVLYFLQDGGDINNDEHSELYFALKRLGFKKPKYIENYLVHFSGFRRGEMGNRILYGGGKMGKILFAKKYIFNYTETKEFFMYSYGSGTPENCIMIYVLKDNEFKECKLQHISSIGSCDVDDKYIEKKGSFLLKLALSFITQKLKEIHDIKIITLRDNSHISCNGKGIQLSDMYFLLNGNTWYGKYEFRPYDEKGKLNRERLKKYIKNQEIIKYAKVKDVEKVIKHFNNKYGSGNYTNNIIDKYKNESLSKFLKKFLDKDDKYNRDGKNCEVFYYMYQDIMEKLDRSNRNSSFMRPI